MATFNMSKQEVLDSSFLEIMRMNEEYNDMNSYDKDKEKDKTTTGNNDGSIDPKVASMPGFNFT